MTVVYFLFAPQERFFFSQTDEVDFSRDIKPVINDNCIVCHGGVKQMSGFSLLFEEEAYSPNESGKRAIVPGNPEESEMIRLLRHHDPEARMPLEAEPLSEEEIGLLERWIEQGADWGEHWAYIPPEPADPQETNSEWVSNGIDHFILKALRERGLEPSPEAERSTLLRRVSFDLTGLPPTMEELEEFLNDESPDAYEKVVDRLLDSPAYGEHLTSMWMDLARYADSKGYEKDAGRNIWQYRDWLIRAFNDDKPFDQFTIEQLAGDLLPNPSDDQIIATAFHRNTMNNDEGGTNDEEFRVAAVMDRVRTTWNVWQATTMECAQCHNHTYDPIRMEDYYRSYAYFNNTADADVPSDDPNLKTFRREADKEELERIREWVGSQTAGEKEASRLGQEYVDLVRLGEPKLHGHYFDDLERGTITSTNSYLAVEDGGHARIKNVDLTGSDRMMIRFRSGRESGVVEVRTGSPQGDLIGQWQVTAQEEWEITSIPVEAREGMHDLYLVFRDPGRSGYVATIMWILFYEELPGQGQPEFAEVRQEFVRLLNASEEVVETPVMTELEGNFRRSTHIFERGNWMVHGEEVSPGVPAALNEMPEDFPKNRLGLARWMVSEENPLTARVTVNRLWARVFGLGIVETISDFGSNGYPPSHPELLDWLALQFMNEHEWSIKKQLKQIVMSATYRQSSKTSPELLEFDPVNRLLARGPRIRLEAEQIRDQALLVSGLLSDKMYGPSVMPPQPEGLWQQVYSGMRWETSEGEDRYRRALYTFWRRTNPYPSLVMFDAPSREVCVTLRINTNTPLQALVTLNDPVYMESAQHLAERMRKTDAESVENQLGAGYRMAMLREADPERLRLLSELYDDTRLYFEENREAAETLTGSEDTELATLTVVANAIMNLDEFLSKS